MTGSYRLVRGDQGLERARGTHSHHTDTADDTPPPAALWPLGAVVAFRRKKGTTGFGQIDRVTPTGLITIRTWLPCPTRTVSLVADDVRLVCTVDELHALLRRR